MWHTYMHVLSSRRSNMGHIANVRVWRWARTWGVAHRCAPAAPTPGQWSICSASKWGTREGCMIHTPMPLHSKARSCIPVLRDGAKTHPINKLKRLSQHEQHWPQPKRSQNKSSQEYLLLGPINSYFLANYQHNSAAASTADVEN